MKNKLTKSMKKNRLYNNLVLLIPIICLSCSTNLEDEVRSYERAHNNHDVEKVMSMYTNDITFEIVGIWIKTGKEQVRNLAEWDLATNSNMIISDIEINNDTATFKLIEGNDSFRLIGIEYMYYEPCRMVFENGLIKEIKAEGTEKSRKAFNEVWPSVYQWLYEEKNEELTKLITSEGEFIYNQENATIWVSLLEEWKE